MKQFIDKLIERLEEELSNANFEKSTKEVNESFYDGLAYAYGYSIGVAMRLATEYLPEINVGNNIQTIDVSELLGESEQWNDFCEWKFTKSVADGGYFYSSGCNHKRFSDLHSFEFCPYCGKKIKVAPYQPKGE